MLTYLLTALKISGAIIAAVYGVYATLTDFHEERAGKRILSRAGRRAIVILLVSSFVSVSSEMFSFLNEKIKSRRADQEEARRHHEVIAKAEALSQTLDQQQKVLSRELEQSVVIDNQVKDSQALLDMTKKELDLASATVEHAARSIDSVFHQTLRQSEPFSIQDQLTLSLTVDIPIDQELVRPYFERITHETYEDTEKASSKELLFRPGTKGFPDPNRSNENTLFKIATLGHLRMNFYRAGQPWISEKVLEHRLVSDEAILPLAANPHCMPSRIELSYNSIFPDILSIQCSTEDLNWFQHGSSWSSYLDFDRGTVLVFLEERARASGINYEIRGLYWARNATDRKHPDIRANKFREVCSHPPYAFGDIGKGELCLQGISHLDRSY